jgi:hypothetical protein
LDAGKKGRRRLWEAGLLWGLGGLLILLFWAGPGAEFPRIPAADSATTASTSLASTTSISAVAALATGTPTPGAPSPETAPSDAATAGAPVLERSPALEATKVDVVVYGTQTSGIAAVRELTREDPELRVALVSSGDYLQSPLAQGLCLEDARNVSQMVGGAYVEWKAAVMAHYHDLGLQPYTAVGRFAYQPSVAAAGLESLLAGSYPGQVLRYAGRLVAASDSPENRYVDVQLADGSTQRIETRYFIDASVEADLARLLGASFRIGRTETVYNELGGPTPAPPTAANNFETAPQRYSVLLTLQVSSPGQTSAPIPFSWSSPENLQTVTMSPRAVVGFANSWTMNIATLPDNGRELNETWNDYPDQPAAFQWVFAPGQRAELAEEAVRRSLGLVAYLRNNGYGEVTVATVPQYPYIREGPRVVGLTTYTEAQIAAGECDDPVAVGCYTLYDRHDQFPPNQIDQTTWVEVPMGALMPVGHPSLLVSTAISTSYEAYSSPARTEPTRANIGGAAGVITALAARLGVEPSQVPYDTVRATLIQRGYQLP